MLVILPTLRRRPYLRITFILPFTVITITFTVITDFSSVTGNFTPLVGTLRGGYELGCASCLRMRICTVWLASCCPCNRRCTSFTMSAWKKGNAIVEFVKKSYGTQTLLDALKAGGWKIFFDGTLA